MRLATSVSLIASIALLAPFPHLTLAAHAQDQLWIRQLGTGSEDVAIALAPDGTGGVMVAGETWGSLGGPNAGAVDAFLARYDSAGHQLWIRQFGTSNLDYPSALAPDGTGGVMVAGSTLGSLGGPNAGSIDAFLARFDSAGNQLWIRQFGTSAHDFASALAPDGTGGVMVAGSTLGSLGGPNAGTFDAYLVRFDSAGNQLWIRQFGTSDRDFANALALDAAGGVMVAGSTRGSLGGPTAGSGDAFLARYDTAGDRLWIRQFGTSTWDDARALAPDSTGGMMVGGQTSGSLGGPNAGGTDAFLAHYDETGKRLWMGPFGTSNTDIALALAPDGLGDVLVAGYTEGSLGGPNAGSIDAFLARYEIDSCYADCDQSTGIGVLDLIDFICFGSSFVNAEPYACDCDTSTGPGVCDMADFICFTDAFMTGCP